MKKKITEDQKSSKVAADKKETDPKGYPLYPASDDVYAKDVEEKDIDPEDISKTKPLNEKTKTGNEKNFTDDVTGEDLDIPGSEEDEKVVNMGSEDEENNYYSLGGDGHTSLEEDNG
jgi:hypothetical protein